MFPNTVRIFNTKTGRAGKFKYQTTPHCISEQRCKGCSVYQYTKNTSTSIESNISMLCQYDFFNNTDIYRNFRYTRNFQYTKINNMANRSAIFCFEYHWKLTHIYIFVFANTLQIRLHFL